MFIQTLSMESDKPKIDEILSHEVKRPVQISSHGNVVGVIIPQEGFDREHAEKAERIIQRLKRMREQANLTQDEVNELLVKDD